MVGFVHQKAPGARGTISQGHTRHWRKSAKPLAVIRVGHRNTLPLKCPLILRFRGCHPNVTPSRALPSTHFSLSKLYGCVSK